MEGNIPTELAPSTVPTVTETNLFPVTKKELDVIREKVVIRPDGRFHLSEAGRDYFGPLRSYLATEYLRKVDNPATVIHRGETVDPWVGAQIGTAKTAEEALRNDASLGAEMLDRAERELGPDAPAILKSIQEKGITYPTHAGEYQRLYSECVRFLLDAIRETSIRQGAVVVLTPEGENFRGNTWRHLEKSPNTGLIIPSESPQGKPLRIVEILPAATERPDNPWDKIEDYSGFRQTRLSARLRSGLDFLTGLTPLGLRKVFAPALQQSTSKAI